MNHNTGKIIVTGFPGQLAQALHARNGDRSHWVFCDRERLDITNPDAIDRVFEVVEPATVVNAAAYTAVDKAESEAEKAESINKMGPQALATACERHGVRLIHISTDFVFGDGWSSPIPLDASPRPESVYGATKLGGETAVEAILGEDATIVRTSWVYSAGSGNFFDTMVRLLGTRKEVGVVVDQIGSPTSAETLAFAIERFLTRPARGMFHVSDLGVASWYDFAVAIRELSIREGLLRDPGLVVPIPSTYYPTPAKRPSYSVLDSRSTYEAIEHVGRHWRDSLHQIVKARTEAAADSTPRSASE